MTEDKICHKVTLASFPQRFNRNSEKNCNLQVPHLIDSWNDLWTITFVFEMIYERDVSMNNDFEYRRWCLLECSWMGFCEQNVFCEWDCKMSFLVDEILWAPSTSIVTKAFWFSCLGFLVLWAIVLFFIHNWQKLEFCSCCLKLSLTIISLQMCFQVIQITIKIFMNETIWRKGKMKREIDQKLWKC